MSKRGATITIIAAICILLAFHAVLQANIDKFRGRTFPAVSTEVEDSPLYLLGAVLGEFRAILADIYWIKLDEYFHGGIPHRLEHLIGVSHDEGDSALEAMLEAMEEGTLGDKGVHSEHKHEHEHGQEFNSVTNIKELIGTKLAKMKDESGKLYLVSRRDKLYLLPGNKDSILNSAAGGMADAELIPLIKIITVFDPRFINAWETGAWYLIRRMDMPEEGLKLLEEGIAQNPENIQLLQSMGYFKAIIFKEYAEALPYLNKALKLSAALPERDDFLMAQVFRVRGTSYRMLGQYQDALTDWQQVALVFPDDKGSQNQISQLKSLIK
jgi:tetratricopeptide (TPR) repeat protein